MITAAPSPRSAQLDSGAIDMGFFTYRQTKKTKQQVRRLRIDQALQAQAQSVQEAAQARQARETELFQALPPEGKAEYRAIKAAYDARAQTWSGWTRTWGGNEIRSAQKELADGKTAVFRKYDLIP
jgi:hypothetical protein